MLQYRNSLDPDRRPPWWKRAGGAIVWPLLWLAAGVAIIAMVLLLWLMPISGNPFDWISKVFGQGSSPGYFFDLSGILQMTLILPTTLLVLLMLSISATLHIYRRRVAVAVLGHVASAVHMRVPLPPYLRAAAESERPALARRLRRLANQLAGGRAIADALNDTAGELPPLMIDRIHAAERSFTLDSALGPIMEKERERAEATRHQTGSRPYNLLVLAVMMAVLFMVMVFVIPKYAQIFADFKIKLPYVTQALIDFSRFIFGYGVSELGGVLLTMLAVPVVFIGIVTMIARAARGLFISRPGRRLTGPLVDRLVWYTPFFGRIVRDRNCAVACETLAEALIVGRPMPDAILLATLPSLNVVLRKRILRWLDGVEQGQPTAIAAREAGIPELWCDMLAGASSDPAAAVVFAGRAYASSVRRRVILLDAIVPVVFTFLLAGMVAFIAVGLITPLANLAGSISIGTGRPR